MKSVYYQGLKKRPTFNEIIGYLESDQELMKYPDRTITRIMHPYYTNLDGQGGLSVADQMQNIQLEQVRRMNFDKMKNQVAEQFQIFTDGEDDMQSVTSEQIRQQEVELNKKRQRLVSSLHE